MLGKQTFPGRTKAARCGAASHVPRADDGRRRRREPERGAAGDRAQTPARRRRSCSGSSTRTRSRSRRCCCLPARSATGSAASRCWPPGSASSASPRWRRSSPNTPGELIALRGADGRRRGDDHAGDAVRDHDRLPARGARQGRRDVGRRRGRRRRARPARLGRPARVALRGSRSSSSTSSWRPSRSSGRSRSCRPPARRVPPRLDLVGTLLSAAALAALVFGIIEGPERGWSEPRHGRRSLAFGVVGIVAFVLLGAAAPRADARPAATSCRRGFARRLALDLRPVLRRLRLPLPGAPVPAARDGLLAARRPPARSCRWRSSSSRSPARLPRSPPGSASASPARPGCR